MVIGECSPSGSPDLGLPAVRVSTLASLVPVLQQMSRYRTTAFPASTIRHLTATEGDQRQAMSRAPNGKTCPFDLTAQGGRPDSAPASAGVYARLADVPGRSCHASTGRRPVASAAGK